MVFSSLSFLCVFLPIVFLVYLAAPGIRAKNGVLLVFSLLFYAYGDPRHVLLLLGCALVNACFGRLLQRKTASAETRGRKWILAVAVACNLLFLLGFKYGSGLLKLARHCFGGAVPVAEIPLPAGISFFTFQAMSYVVDVYRGRAEAETHFGRLLLYLSFFPQLIAGPIVKYSEIERQLRQRELSLDGVAAGLRRFTAGLCKKVLLASTLGVAADAVFAAESAKLNILSVWIGAISYMLQIYFDFSGYSDMAIGLGAMFGFHFQENFRYPYCADSVRGFWRRWHISLTSWFREYLYIPLGGNRCGAWRTILNRFCVFLCTGIWHGANVTYLLWGVFHGAFVAVESLAEIHLNLSGRGNSLQGDCLQGVSLQDDSTQNASLQDGSTQNASLQGGSTQDDRIQDGSMQDDGIQGGSTQDDNILGGGTQGEDRRRSHMVCIKRVGAHAYTLLVVCVGFVIFRASTVSQAVQMIREMFFGFHFEPAAVSLALRQLHPLYLVTLAAAIIAATPISEHLKKWYGYEMTAYVLSVAGLVLCMLQLAGSTHHPFIYYQF